MASRRPHFLAADNVRAPSCLWWTRRSSPPPSCWSANKHALRAKQELFRADCLRRRVSGSTLDLRLATIQRKHLARWGHDSPLNECRPLTSRLKGTGAFHQTTAGHPTWFAVAAVSYLQQISARLDVGQKIDNAQLFAIGVIDIDNGRNYGPRRLHCVGERGRPFTEGQVWRKPARSRHFGSW